MIGKIFCVYFGNRLSSSRKAVTGVTVFSKNIYFVFLCSRHGVTKILGLMEIFALLTFSFS